MAFWLIDQMEKAVIRLLVDNYPEWSMTPKIISIGRHLTSEKRVEQAEWKILVQRPLFVRHLRMIHCLAHNTAQRDWDMRVQANSIWFYENCYIQNLDEATAFFSAVFYPRYIWTRLKEIATRSLQRKPKSKGDALNELEKDFLVLSIEQSVSQSRG